MTTIALTRLIRYAAIECVANVSIITELVLAIIGKQDTWTTSDIAKPILSGQDIQGSRRVPTY